MQTIPGVGNFNVDDFKRLLTHLEGGKVTVAAQTSSPLVIAIVDEYF